MSGLILAWNVLAGVLDRRGHGSGSGSPGAGFGVQEFGTSFFGGPL